MASKKSAPLGVGLDIGTMNLVAARRAVDGTVETSRMRDAFLDLDASAKKDAETLRGELHRPWGGWDHCRGRCRHGDGQRLRAGGSSAPFPRA